MKRSFLLLTLLLLATAPVNLSCGDAEAATVAAVTPAPDHSDTIEIVAPVSGDAVELDGGRLSFVPPAGWIDCSELLSLVCVFASPDAESTANMNVVRTVWDAGTRRSFVQEVKKSLSSLCDSYRLVGDGILELGGGEAWWIEGAFSMEGMPLRNLQLAVRRGGQCYTFTFTASASEYSELRKQFFDSARSIAIL
jgi:hypothetical protein